MLLSDEEIRDIVKAASNGSAFRPMTKTPLSVRISRATEAAVLAKLGAQSEPVLYLIEFDNGHVETLPHPVTAWMRGMWESAGKRFIEKPLYTHPAPVQQEPVNQQLLEALRRALVGLAGINTKVEFEIVNAAITAVEGRNE